MSDSKLKFSNVNGFFLPSVFSDFDIIFVREVPINMSISRALTHEIAHYNHRLKVGPEKFEALRKSSVPDNLKAEITDQIRAYAATSPTEYVAEYFSYTQMGYVFPKDMKKYYKECNGP